MTDLNFCNSVVGGPTSTPLKSAGLIVDLAGDVTVGVSSLAELAGDFTVGVSSPADLAGSVNVGVAPSAVAEVASSADLSGDVTVGVTSLADPVSVATAGVAFREECGDSVMVPSGSVCDYDDFLRWTL